MFVVDTNILIYAADRGSRFHERSRELLEAWRLQPSAWFLTWGIVYEFLRVTTHPRVLRRPWRLTEALRFVDAVLAAPGLTVLTPTDRHATVLREVVAELPALAGNIIHDAATAVLMREHGIRQIQTRDADFHRFRFLEVVDPLSGP
ncbi:MAG TPA: TA system VapC family ribonuclease toxin [Gemmatimonadota bacterium]|nr:TA system VapC family ribonuclease toxin [Gemmatimonadota bacterium]